MTSGGHSEQNAVTMVLRRIANGESNAAEDLLPLVYAELKSLAHHYRQKLHSGQTLQTTALVHEAWIRLGGPVQSSWDNRAHFYGAAARAMRQILVDEARRRNSLKRQRPGPDSSRIDLIPAEEGSSLDLLALDEALTELEQGFARHAQVVMLRFFAGLSHEEIAEALSVTTRTVTRDWLFARTWLWKRLGESPKGD